MTSVPPPQEPPQAEIVTVDAPSLARLATGLVERARQPRPTRYLLGIAGIGGSGKSTLARQLLAAVDTLWPGASRLVAMDGFHFPNAELDRRGLRDCKGSPETFDAHAFIALLRRARDPSQHVDVPVYDRHRHEPVLPRDDAHALSDRTRLVIVEGNYLLLDSPPWSQLAAWLHETWFLDTPINLARQRIIDRHIRGGRSPDNARDWYQRVDRPNASLILQCRRPPDRLLRCPAAQQSDGPADARPEIG